MLFFVFFVRIYALRVPNLIVTTGDAHRLCTRDVHGVISLPTTAYIVGPSREHTPTGSAPTGLHREGIQANRSRKNCMYTAKLGGHYRHILFSFCSKQKAKTVHVGFPSLKNVSTSVYNKINLVKKKFNK